MAKIEKIVIIALIIFAIFGLALSYYDKVSRQDIEFVSGAIEDEAEKAHDAISSKRVISINTADKYTLAKLPGIGPYLAQRIIDYRREHGRFYSADELMAVKGLGPKKYEAIKSRIRVDE